MMKVEQFHPRGEASGKQTRFISVLSEQTGISLECVLVELWGMPLVAAFSDRPWMRLMKREASAVIERLLALKESDRIRDARIDRACIDHAGM